MCMSNQDKDEEKKVPLMDSSFQSMSGQEHEHPLKNQNHKHLIKVIHELSLAVYGAMTMCYYYYILGSLANPNESMEIAP